MLVYSGVPFEEQARANPPWLEKAQLDLVLPCLAQNHPKATANRAKISRRHSFYVMCRWVIVAHVSRSFDSRRVYGAKQHVNLQ